MFLQRGGRKLRTILGSGGKTRLWKRRQVHVELMIYMKACYDDIYICQNTRQVPALLDDHHVHLDDVHSHHNSLLASLHSHRIWHQRLQWIISTVMRTQQLQPCRHSSAQWVFCKVYFSAQPNKLRPILKFRKYFPVEHIFVSACSSARKVHFFKF